MVFGLFVCKLMFSLYCAVITGHQIWNTNAFLSLFPINHFCLLNTERTYYTSTPHKVVKLYDCFICNQFTHNKLIPVHLAGTKMPNICQNMTYIDTFLRAECVYLFKIP